MRHKQTLKTMDKKRLRLGIIGLKNQGAEHLKAAKLLEHSEIVAVCDTSLDELKKVRKSHPEMRCHESIDEILQDPQVDAFVMALPHHVYPEYWEGIVRCGKPVLKEKPLGRSLPEAFSFVQTARQHQCYLQTAIQRRTHPSYVYLRNLLKGNELHSISVIMHLGFDPERDGSGWRGDSHQAGGGVVLDYGYHGIDLLFFLLGKVELVSAVLWRGGRPATCECLESEARIVLRSGSTWIHLDLMVGGEPDSSRPSGFKKNEKITVDCDLGRITADRCGVQLDDEILFECERDWPQSMATQLDDFARNVIEGRFDGDCVWEQIPAMRVVEQIYTEAGLIWPFLQKKERNLS